MCHESLCHIKNNVPHIYRKYYLKKFSRLVSSKSAELTSKILSCEGRDLLLQLQLYRQLCPTQERIFEVNSADFEDTNLENFFTEYLLYMCGTLFLMWQGDSWHMTHLIVYPWYGKWINRLSSSNFNFSFLICISTWLHLLQLSFRFDTRTELKAQNIFDWVRTKVDVCVLDGQLTHLIYTVLL